MAVARTGVNVGPASLVQAIKVQASEGDRRRTAVEHANCAWVRRNHLVNNVARVIEHLPCNHGLPSGFVLLPVWVIPKLYPGQMAEAEPAKSAVAATVEKNALENMII